MVPHKQYILYQKKNSGSLNHLIWYCSESIYVKKLFFFSEIVPLRDIKKDQEYLLNVQNDFNEFNIFKCEKQIREHFGI